MSITIERVSMSGIACMTPKWMSRASSTPEMTSTTMDASLSARSIKTSAFLASRTALVAIARSSAPWTSAIRRMLRSAMTPRSIASGLSSFMSPEPSPSRTISFSRAITSKPEWVARAITRWKLFVPISSAPITPDDSVTRMRVSD